MEKYEINMNGFKWVNHSQLEISDKVINDSIATNRRRLLVKEIQRLIMDITKYIIEYEDLNNMFLNDSYTWIRSPFYIESHKLCNKQRGDILINIKSEEITIPIYKLEKIDI